jgi:acyl-CoA synthetase (AMP-forming)/AMP-acid ligase II
VIFGHPKVADVAIIGQPDKDWGESVKAIVAPKKGVQVGPEEIIEYCRGEIAIYKIPNAGEYLPRRSSSFWKTFLRKVQMLPQAVPSLGTPSSRLLFRLGR